MAKYRRIAICIWGDAKFKALSKPKPNAQTLWIYLLSGEHTLAIPGLSRVGEQALAEAIGWSLPAFRRCFREIEQQGMAEVDWDNRVLWLPKAVQHNPPESVNVVKGWVRALDEIPECPLKAKAVNEILAYLQDKDVDKSQAFYEAFRDGIDEAIALHLHIHLQEHLQEHDISLCSPPPGDGKHNALKPQTSEELNFEKARQLWPGKKRGFRVEFDNFRKKHKDWRELLDDEGLAECVRILIERKAYSPGWWPMFSKFVNQSLYEIALEPPEEKRK